MAPKKEKKEKKKEGEEAPKGATFTEVEKTFLELQIAECNRKIARLRTAVDEYEIRNEELQKAYDKLDVDRADIIAYLKKTLNLKNEENIELKEKCRGLEETREIETAEFKETVAELERNFSIMKDQLTSENKLLAGKINTLEEFRAVRDDLMRKFDNQEKEFKEQELKYKRIIYDTEKKFIIGKDKLKKEMEARLLQLAQDFQDASELRIAASTHRVIRENIALNNELDSILSSQGKVAELTEKYKESERQARIAKESAEEERDTAINKSIVQLKVIDQLTTAFEKMKKDKALMERNEYNFETMTNKLNKLTKDNDALTLKVRILEQNLHGKLSDQNKKEAETNKIHKQSNQLKKVLKEAAVAIQAALKLDEWADTDRTREILDRQVLLARLLTIVTQYKDIHRAESMDTVASCGKIYEEGDLGFIPRPVKAKAVASATVMQASAESSAEKLSSVSSAVSSSPLSSLATMQSLKIIPVSSKVIVAKESLASFVTSTQSSVTEEELVEEEELDEIAKQLEASKIEIQKSIMKDLAHSQLAMDSQQKFSQEIERKRRESELLEEVVNEQGEEAGKEGDDVEVVEEEGDVPEPEIIDEETNEQPE